MPGELGKPRAGPKVEQPEAPVEARQQSAVVVAAAAVFAAAFRTATARGTEGHRRQRGPDVVNS